MVKIYKDRPLPEHTKLDYNECYAKIILEDLFADRYGKLLILDKPDLQNDDLSIGVEITSAVPQSHREALKLWYTMPYVDREKQEKNKERMKQLGAEYEGDIQTWPTKCYSSNVIDGNPIENFLKVLEIKIKKLNSNNYKFFNNYDLFVDSDIDVADSILSKVLERIISINKGKKIFSYIYLLSQDKILLFDMKLQAFNKVDYIDKQFSYANKAREMVIQGESNDET